MYLFAEIGQGDSALKRKYQGDHDNENGVDSPNNLTTGDSVNGSNVDDDNSTPAPHLPSPEVSIYG